jgi:hypothetical protein
MSWIKQARNFKNKVFRKDSIKMKSYPSKESYDFFKKNNPDIDITLKQYKKIVKEYLQLGIDKAIDHRDGFEFTGFAHMIIISRPKTEKTRIVNKAKSYELDTEVSTLNLHSDGRLCKFIFSNKSRKYRIRNKRLWTFKFNNKSKKKVSEAFKKNYTKYLRVYKMGHIAKRLMDY